VRKPEKAFQKATITEHRQLSNVLITIGIALARSHGGDHQAGQKYAISGIDTVSMPES
jgi:hypothetical protein